MSKDDAASTEGSDLEERVKRLEECLKELREPIEKTLIDLRRMLSDLENPFNILLATQGQPLSSKSPGVEDSSGSSTPPTFNGHFIKEGWVMNIEKTESEDGLPQGDGIAEPSRIRNDQPVDFKLSHNHDKKPIEVSATASPLPLKLISNNRHLSVLACASILLSMFDEEELKQSLNLYIAKGWVSRETALAIKEALELLPRDLSLGIYGRREARRAGMEDHVIAIHLLSRLDNGDDEALILMLLLLSRIRGQGPCVNNGFVFDLGGEDKRSFNMGG